MVAVERHFARRRCPAMRPDCAFGGVAYLCAFGASNRYNATLLRYQEGEGDSAR